MAILTIIVNFNYPVTMNSAMLLIAIVCIGIAIFAFLQAGKKRKQDGAVPRKDPFADATGAGAKFSPQSLGPGAVLSWGSTDYVIRGSLTISQGPYTWYEHMLDGGSGTEWLGVEVDEGQLELVMWRTQHGEVPRPLGRVEVNGKTYRETERGVARYTSEGNTGLPDQGETHFIDYVGDSATNTTATAGSVGATGKISASGAPGDPTTISDERLGLESFDGSDWEYSIGRVVLPGEFIVYPAPKG